MISVSEALEILRRHVAPLEPEAVPLSRAFGRVLAKDLFADQDFPSFETTAMDGYAVRFAGGGEATYRVRPGVCAAGDALPDPLRAGEALRIMTGALVPEGTDAVVPVEEAKQEEGGLRPNKPPGPGAHLRRRGEVFRKGDRVLEAGIRLSPEAILLAATIGAEPVPVFRRPRCAVAGTGSELVAAGTTPGPGQIRNGNGPALAAALSRRGIEAHELPAVEDRRPALEAFFGALGEEWDLVVTTGGVSAGDFDLTPDAAAAAGFEILFHGVAVKPGKPIAFGKRGCRYWLGLPGNPVSALTMFEIFGGEALDRMAGLERGRRPVTARLRSEISERGRREVFRDCLLTDEGGQLFAEALASLGSHDVRTQARRNGLLKVPAGGGRWPAGALLECVWLSSVFE